MEHCHLPPKHVDVLVIGGGPAGSYAASVLALEGMKVTVFEADKFPRYHIGESLIPSIRPYMRFIGCEEKLANYGFHRKPGSAIKFNQYKHEGYTDFVALGADNNAWNVTRSEFDHLLLNHSRTCGTSVYERTKVTSVTFSPDDPSRPTSVTYSHVPPPCSLSTPPSTPPPSPTRGGHDTNGFFEPVEPVVGTTSFNYMIDASGRTGVMSTRYLKNRHFNSSLKNVAVWGYWTDVGTYGADTPRQGSPWFEALIGKHSVEVYQRKSDIRVLDESGWAWFIPLHNGKTSIGVVMNQEVYNENKSTLSSFPPSVSTPNPSESTMVARYISNLGLAPGLVELITENGKMGEGSVKMASDFSYSAPSYAGNGYRIIGDAAAFIDPFFSSGVHLAITGALSAALTICASIRNNCSEQQAAGWHTKRVATSYTRFQVVVLSAYKQIRNQSHDILSDIDENNFDRAFTFLRPVIQGASDMGSQLSETELQKSLDFCVNLFNPTTPEQHERLLTEGKVSKELLDVTAPITDPSILSTALKHDHITQGGSGSSSEETFYWNDCERMVLDKVNARKVVHNEYAINNLESEPLDGYVAHLKRGKLGLAPV
ncbi:FAD/NAD(P)-binding domain-containing protein [Dendrothele bispora CBS 962.96]|uniref:FAD/NAD(P)-binding domain-containing protein n=1 Tax=Dendrothele bispora (strain CBS 962.96) TaxID=1314807 RepID=A0A4S8L8L8_DENBC|nr:FAD/NAD(P)-binding domain-containing protein [Dendrothele bispora CBS 962.96]